MQTDHRGRAISIRPLARGRARWRARRRASARDTRARFIGFKLLVLAAD